MRREEIRAKCRRTTAAAMCVACLPLACSRATPTAEAGRALYTSNGCASCHGASGRGDGTIAATLEPRPRDFRDAAAFKNGADAASIAETLINGLSRYGGRMPQFNHLTRDERASLALYVISLRAAARDAKEQQ